MGLPGLQWMAGTSDEPSPETKGIPMQRIQLTSLTVLIAGSLLLIGAQPAEAQSASVAPSSVENYLANGVAGLSPRQLIELYELQNLSAPQTGDSSPLFVSELIRQWLGRPGALPQMEADALLNEFERLHSEVSPEFEALVLANLTDLTTAPSPYNPPIYIPSGPVVRLQRPVVSPSRPLLGPITKDGISRISSSR